MIYFYIYSLPPQIDGIPPREERREKSPGLKIGEKGGGGYGGMYHAYTVQYMPLDSIILRSHFWQRIRKLDQNFEEKKHFRYLLD